MLKPRPCTLGTHGPGRQTLYYLTLLHTRRCVHCTDATAKQVLAKASAVGCQGVCLTMSDFHLMNLISHCTPSLCS